jgi:hypothetical protein
VSALEAPCDAAVIVAITGSRLKLAAFCRGGKFLERYPTT